MNSKGHLIISLLKSIIRMASCTLTIVYNNVFYISLGFIIAEIAGILEEIVDNR